MTNIEFLVDELRKAHETIAKLRKTNAKLSLANLDALAFLKKRMEENS